MLEHFDDLLEVGMLESQSKHGEVLASLTPVSDLIQGAFNSLSGRGVLV